jgi:hypothetical protein
MAIVHNIILLATIAQWFALISLLYQIIILSMYFTGGLGLVNTPSSGDRGFE